MVILSLNKILKDSRVIKNIPLIKLNCTMFRSTISPEFFFCKSTKNYLVLALLTLIGAPAFSQSDEAHYAFSNETHFLEFDLAENGSLINNAFLINKVTGDIESGSGSWFRVNMNAVDPDYSGPEGWYEFSTENCSYTFKFSNNEDSLFLTNECSNGQVPVESILTLEKNSEVIDAPDTDFVIIDGESVDETVDEMTTEFNISTLGDLYVAMVTKSQFENDFMSGQIQVSGPEFQIKYDAATGEAKGFTPSEALAFTVKMTSWGPEEDPIFPTLELTNVGLSIFPQPQDAAISWAIRYSGIGFFELYEPYSEEVFYILAPQAGD